MGYAKKVVSESDFCWFYLIFGCPGGPQIGQKSNKMHATNNAFFGTRKKRKKCWKQIWGGGVDVMAGAHRSFASRLPARIPCIFLACIWIYARISCVSYMHAWFYAVRWLHARILCREFYAAEKCLQFNNARRVRRIYLLTRHSADPLFYTRALILLQLSTRTTMPKSFIWFKNFDTCARASSTGWSHAGRDQSERRSMLPACLPACLPWS